MSASDPQKASERQLEPSSPAGTGVAQTNDSDISLKEIFDVLKHGLIIIRARWYWGALAASIIIGLGAMAILRKKTEYTAQATLLAQSTLDKMIGIQSADSGGDAQVRENSMRNFLSVMTSRKFLTKLTDSFTPEETAKIIEPYKKDPLLKDSEVLYGFLEGKVAAERERGREFFTIQVSHVDPDVAILVADRFTAVFLALVQSEYRNASREAMELLQKQADALRSQIAKDEEDRLEFRKKNKIISRADNQSILTERLKRLDINLSEIRVKRLQLETQFDKAKKDRAEAEYPWDNPYLATYADNAQLRQQFSQLTSQRAIFSTRYGPNHPKMRDLDGSIRGLQDNIKRNFDTAVADLENQLDVARQSESQLQREFDESFAASIEIEKLASRYEAIGGDSDAMRQGLQKLQQKIGEATISSQLPSDFMQVVDPGFLTKPRVPKKLVLGLFICFLASVAFIVAPLISNLFDVRVKSTSDVEVLLGKPMAAAIPKLMGSDEERAHIVRDRVDVVASETFSSIAGFLEINGAKSYPKVILNTSTLPGEGKSMISSNLASAYTALNRRTLLIDLDLRRPTQQRIQHVTVEGGFLPWANAGFPMIDLHGKSNPLAIRTLPDGTDLIVAGGHESQPSHYFVGKELSALIQELRNTYEVVILDTSPAGLFQDSLILSRHATDRLLVVRESKAPVEQVKKIMSDFQRASVPFHAIVLNGFNPKAAHAKLAYGYKSSQEGYSYSAKKA